ncbi:hypothetical protein NCAS_0A05440 [Naumovozyma castellii]|uniref:Uncharacterized protein n=1 Tax=Naumovozyma castellii TaxID=27288 RepID=G0V6K6_NAUCA|nr:hypothetical protein NCAS_0A05440 [Naumovozyma castellii CBS 4309]CCC67102.1 hypothetical protein NCAS_0A05440 [Naumovozyma castellii CBS 4309]
MFAQKDIASPEANEVTGVKLHEIIPRVKGTVILDDKLNVVKASGIGKGLKKTHIQDVLHACHDELGRVGYSVYSDTLGPIHLWLNPMDRQTTLVFTAKQAPASGPNQYE